MVRNKVDYLPLDELRGRIATIIPGERLTEAAQPMIDYLKVFERGANLFPGFENEIQGVYRETMPGRQVRFHTDVLSE